MIKIKFQIEFSYFFFSDPDDCMMLDFQATRIGSLAHDLNFFIYSSLNSEVILDSEEILRIYYNFFVEMLSAGGLPTPFRFPELQQEVFIKRLLGFKMVMESLYRMRSISPHTLNDYDITALEDLLIEEDQTLFSKDCDNLRLTALYDSMFNETMLIMTTTEEFKSIMHSGSK